ncbi:hypothetical protein [Nocardia aurantia]|uniref:hypothetical protein n=1 Tax=Nocardia aurantia TaxID=2585199 RepID=UPI001296B866|nr:hypothetical protein [Nocardia aurantia]
MTFVELLPPAVESELQQDAKRKGDDFLLRRLPGHRAVVQLAGLPFRFEVRVIEEPGKPPRIMELRIYSPPGFGDVAITNADLKSVPLARIAAAAGSGVLTSLNDVATMPERLAAPEQHTAAARSPQAQPRGRGRPRKLTDEFLQRIAEYAREGHRRGQPIPQYVAACVEPEPRRQARPDTVRWWLAKAREGRFLTPGELTRRPRMVLRER